MKIIETDMVKDNIVFINYSEKVKAYAKLIEPAGSPTTYINRTNKLDEGFVWIGRRWLVEWVHPSQIPLFCRFRDWICGNLLSNRRFLWDQKSLAGHKTHRTISYQTTMTWEEYSELYGYNVDLTNGDE